MQAARNLILGGAFVAAAAGALALGACREAFAGYEKAQYRVLDLIGDNVEIREYPARLVAEVEVEGTGEGSANEAFRILAAFIFGKNQSKNKIDMTVPVTARLASEKIAMTTPVTTSGAKSIKMQFYMPRKYSIESLPEPKDGRIKIFVQASAKYAVLKFSGPSSDRNMKLHESKLFDLLRAKSIETEKIPLRAVYNPPWTLPFLRRNEIWVEMKSPAAG